MTIPREEKNQISFSEDHFEEQYIYNTLEAVLSLIPIYSFLQRSKEI